MTYRSASARAVAFDDALREAMSDEEKFRQFWESSLVAGIPYTLGLSMRTPVSYAVQPEAAGGADPAAGADGPERHAADRVAADPAVLDSDFDRTYRDSVQHFTAYATAHDAVYVNDRPITAEAVRQSRLARWQAQR